MSKLDCEIIRAEAIVALAKERWDSENINVCDVAPFCHPAHTSEYVSEGNDNGAWVKAWVWVDFEDTMFDKTEEGEQPND